MIIEQLKKLIRVIPGNQVEDTGNIEALVYNEAAGGYKAVKVGPHLTPIKTGTNTYTTDASTVRQIPPGSVIYLYNPTAGALSVTLLSKAATASALAAGSTNAQGDVGVPVPANSWFQVSNYDKDRIITQSGLLTFIMFDVTRIRDQKQKK